MSPTVFINEQGLPFVIESEPVSANMLCSTFQPGFAISRGQNKFSYNQFVNRKIASLIQLSDWICKVLTNAVFCVSLSDPHRLGALSVTFVKQ